MFISSNYDLAADTTDEHYNLAQSLPPLTRLSAAVVDVIDAMIPSIDLES